MTAMFEVYYKPPSDPSKEAAVIKKVSGHGGWLSYREPQQERLMSVCLTYEFNDRESANEAADVLRGLGEHVEGPVEYGP